MDQATMATEASFTLYGYEVRSSSVLLIRREQLTQPMQS